ncbi:MAG: S-layer homology domain-containing protein [Eubacteriales bacterium]
MQKKYKNLGQKFWMFIFFLGTLLFLQGNAYAQQDSSTQPPVAFPALYYGTVKTEAGQAVASGEVKAFVDGKLCGKLPFFNGCYGVPAWDPYTSRLLVYSKDDLSGKEVKFEVLVNGREYLARTSLAKVIWESKSKQQVDLTVVTEDTLPAAFDDLKGHWAKDTAQQAIDQGLFKGYENHSFRPENLLTRVEFSAMMARILVLGAGEPEVLENISDAADIPAWAQSSVAASVYAGILKGYPEENGKVYFRPHKPLNRAELAAILVRALNQVVGAQQPPAVAPASFSDQKQIPDWAGEAVNLIVQKGILKGYPDGTFQPLKEVTRAEAAVTLERFWKALTES